MLAPNARTVNPSLASSLMAAQLALHLLPAEYAVLRLPACTPFPSWALDPAATGLVALARTVTETSVICPAAVVPLGATPDVVAGLRCLGLRTPPFDAVGVMAALSTALAAAGVWLLAVSTFDTDYLLVRGHQATAAVAALRGAGVAVDVAADDADVR